jgi:hypothetical protein
MAAKWQVKFGVVSCDYKNQLEKLLWSIKNYHL